MLRNKQKVTDKVYIPALEFPEINFMGLLIGPRGNTLKKMESQSGAKISIRGKGAMKEGKKAQPGDDEELHAHLTGTDEEVNSAAQLINEIIALATSTPEGDNALKQAQLRELAMLNGTFREEDMSLFCNNCKRPGHRTFECPERPAASGGDVHGCRLCGSTEHDESTCIERHNPDALRQAHIRNQNVTNEYQNLMAELGGAAPGQVTAVADDGSIPPWQKAGTEIPPWHAGPPAGGPQALPPWQQAAAVGQAPPPWQQATPPSGGMAPWQQQQQQQLQPPYGVPPPYGQQYPPPPHPPHHHHHH